MNAPFTPPAITPTETAQLAYQRRLKRLRTDYASAIKLAKAAQDHADSLLDAIQRTERHGRYIAPVDYDLLVLCNAAIDVADDGNFLALRKLIMDDNDWDENGYPNGCDDPAAALADYRFEMRRDAGDAA